MIHLPVDNAPPSHQIVSLVNTHLVVKITEPSHCQNVNFVVCDASLDASIFTILVLKPQFTIFGHVLFIVEARNINPNDRAADTYTGTIASHMNLTIVMLFKASGVLPSLKNKVRANTGENIAYIHSIVARLKSAKIIATKSTQNIKKNTNQKVNFLAKSHIVLKDHVKDGSMSLKS
jgi:hypothetical protein